MNYGNSDREKTHASLIKIKNTSKWISRFLLGCTFLFAVLWILLIPLSILSIVGILGISGLPSSAYELVILALVGLVAICLVYIGHKVFGDVAAGESPFAMVQVKRLRTVALLLLLYTVFEIALSPGLISAMSVEQLSVGYAVTNSVPAPILSINLGALLGAAVFWALSLIFEYGVLLQEFSDETL